MKKYLVIKYFDTFSVKEYYFETKEGTEEWVREQDRKSKIYEYQYRGDRRMNELKADVKLFMSILKSSIEVFNLYWEVTKNGDFIFGRGTERIAIKKDDIINYFEKNQGDKK